MIKERLGILIATFLLCVPLSAHAQGTYTEGGVRNGYWRRINWSSEFADFGNTAAGSASITPSANRNSGTGQKPSEGAFGLTPQLQKELGD